MTNENVIRREQRFQDFEKALSRLQQGPETLHQEPDNLLISLGHKPKEHTTRAPT